MVVIFKVFCVVHSSDKWQIKHQKGSSLGISSISLLLLSFLTPGTPMSKQNQKRKLNLSARKFPIKSSHGSRKNYRLRDTIKLYLSTFSSPRSTRNLENTFKKFPSPNPPISYLLSIIIQVSCQNTNKYCQQDELFLDFVSLEGDIILKLGRKCVC